MFPGTRTLATQRTNTTQDARYLARRVLGDLLSIHEKFDIGTVRRMRDLAHDLEIGLDYGCVTTFRIFLYPQGESVPSHCYHYERASVGVFQERTHSGGITRAPSLRHGWHRCEIRLSAPDVWYDLRQRGALRLPWSSCVGISTAGMTSSTDGGYASGALGVSRTLFTR